MKYFLLVACLAMSVACAAQKFMIKGQLTDTLGQSLPHATVLLQNPKDSSLVNFSVSDTEGNFQIRNVNKGEYIFKVTFLGFRPLIQKVVATGTEQFVLELGKLEMVPV